MQGMKDPYEDQLSAARYKAERDVAIQERDRLKRKIERLRYVERDRDMLRGAVERIANVFGVVLGEDLTRCAGRMAAAAERLSRRIMPPGMEWPCDANEVPIVMGETVWANGDRYGDCRAWHVSRVVPGVPYSVEAEDANGEKRELKPRWVTHKRPAPKVLDADGAEIRVGDEVWTTRDLDKFTVTNPNNGKFLSVSCKGEDGEDYCCYPTDLTHRAPALAADAKPLREGETVWKKDGTKLTVERLVTSVDGLVGCSDGTEAFGVPVIFNFIPSELYHELPDSWERLEDDATLVPAAYCHDRGLACACDPDPDAATYIEAMSRDLVRRARALAERGQ